MAALKHWVPSLLWAALIFSLSHMSAPPGTSLAPDYVGHFLIYGCLALTLIWGITAGFRQLLTGRRVLIVWLLATLYGISDEVHQSFIPERHASLQDVVVNTLGALIFSLGVYFAQAAYRRAAGKPTPRSGC